jgi:hypothetical protein
MKIPVTFVGVDPMTFNLVGNRWFIVSCDEEKGTVTLSTTQDQTIEKSFTDLNNSKGRFWFGHYSDEEIRTAKEIP